MNTKDVVGMYSNDDTDAAGDDIEWLVSGDDIEWLVIFVAERGQLCFQYLYSSESNHGFDRVFSEGTVTLEDPDTVVLTRTTHREWGGEDWYNNDYFRVSAGTERLELLLDEHTLSFGGKRFSRRGDITAQVLSRFTLAKSESNPDRTRS